MLGKLLQSVKVPHYKNTSFSVPQRMPSPKEVILPMSMHIGAPAKPVVKKGDKVKIGQVIGEAQGGLSVPIHATVSGTVKGIEEVVSSNGTFSTAVVIESDGLMEMDESLTPPVLTDFDSFIQALRAAGLVGLGGAGFPTYAKMNVDRDKVEHILINGAECEPYITSDTHTMIHNADRIVWGLEMLHRFYPGARIIFGIEDNKPNSQKMMRERTQEIPNVTVRSLPSSYPQGAEKTLIYNTTGKIVPEGGLPITVGCLVINTTTLANIGKYIHTGIPLVTKCVTIDGTAVKTPQNVIVPIGTRIRDVIEFVGGFREEPKKVMYGGPMMGIAIPSLDEPILKNTNAVTFMSEKEAAIPEPTACISCGRCIDACPMNLMPTELEQATIKKDSDRLKKLKVTLCMECGSCAFVCPAKRNLVESHKIAKQLLREAK